jgi:hypothetical protein
MIHIFMEAHMEPTIRNETLESSQAPVRRPYTPPILEEYGDVRDLTLGGSPGAGDSTSMNVKLPA